MECQICGRELDVQKEPERIPFSPSAHAIDFAGQPICTREKCLQQARKKWYGERDEEWKGVHRYELKE